MAYIFFGQPSPDFSSFSIHIHRYHRASTVVFVFLTGIDDSTSIQGSFSVTGRDFDRM